MVDRKQWDEPGTFEDQSLLLSSVPSLPFSSPFEAAHPSLTSVYILPVCHCTLSYRPGTVHSPPTESCANRIDILGIRKSKDKTFCRLLRTAPYTAGTHHPNQSQSRLTTTVLLPSGYRASSPSTPPGWVKYGQWGEGKDVCM